MTVIGLTGYAQSGKDTAAAFLVERGFTRVSFADILRDSLYKLNPVVSVARETVRHGWGRVRSIVDDMGWDVAKVQYPEIRELLQRFGTEVGRELYGENFWVQMAMAKLVDGQDYVIPDVRFPNEAHAVHELGGIVLRVVRPGTGAVNSHVSDTGIDALPTDGEIWNGGDFDDLLDEVLETVALT